MKKTFILLAVLLAGAAPAYAASSNDSCLLSKDALVPVMKHSAPGHKVVMDASRRGIIETATAKDGSKVTYSVNGCSHFAFEYKFENIPGGVPKNPADPFALPLKLIANIPFRDQFDVEALVRALKEKQASNHAAFDNQGSINLSCGDAVCKLTLGETTVSISYDLAI